MSAADSRGRRLRLSELRAVAECALCGRGVMHTGMPLFYRVKLERFGIKADAIHRQTGLEMHMGNAALAAIMGPDEEAAVPVMDPVEASICETCSHDPFLLARIADRAADARELDPGSDQDADVAAASAGVKP